jgi:uncharacterized coiled-coil protein SlyX
MATFDPEAMAGQVVEAAKAFLARAVAAINKRVDEHDHRLVRHSEHLARLETRLAALERAADKK